MALLDLPPRSCPVVVLRRRCAREHGGGADPLIAQWWRMTILTSRLNREVTMVCKGGERVKWALTPMLLWSALIRDALRGRECSAGDPVTVLLPWASAAALRRALVFSTRGEEVQMEAGMARQVHQVLRAMGANGVTLLEEEEHGLASDPYLELTLDEELEEEDSPWKSDATTVTADEGTGEGGSSSTEIDGVDSINNNDASHIRCPRCDFSASPYRVLEHLSTRHYCGAALEALWRAKGSREDCYLCGRAFNSKSGVLRHIGVVHRRVMHVMLVGDLRVIEGGGGNQEEPPPQKKKARDSGHAPGNEKDACNSEAGTDCNANDIVWLQREYQVHTPKGIEEEEEDIGLLPSLVSVEAIALEDHPYAAPPL